jgi:hypothetical protein
MKKDISKSNEKQTSSDVDAFLKKVAATPKPTNMGGSGRLIFAMDATASRQPTWDHACHIQREMFNETANIGGLELQIAFFRGFGEFKATRWTRNSSSLTGPMSRVNCLGGHTQIKKILNHALKETKKKPVSALVYVGDAMEEQADDLCHLAGQLGLFHIPLFMFQEGLDPTARSCFQQMARLSGGAYCSFDAASAQTLKDLLRAVAVYAAGGRKALTDFSRRTGGETLLLSQQIK